MDERTVKLFKTLSIDIECRIGNLHDSTRRKNIIQKFMVIETNDYLRMALGSKDIEIPKNAIASNACA
jgi:hypothetical protein